MMPDQPRLPLVEVRAVVRRHVVDRVVHALRDAGVSRQTVQQVHALDAGVDPATAAPSVAEGSSVAEASIIQFVCPRERSGAITVLVRLAARTGRTGDGVITVYPLDDVIEIHSGDAGPEVSA